MQPIKDLLNKIKWDEREKPEDYTIYYFDRVSKTLRNSKRISGAQKIPKEFSRELIKINYIDIKRTEGNFIIIERDNEEVNIPMHRIREVRKSNEIVWKR